MTGTLLVACGAMLAGCDNLVEHSSDASWQDVGTAEPPAPPPNDKSDYTVTANIPGQGDTVRPADLVYVHIRRGTTVGPVDFNAWLWTGSAREGDALYPMRLELGPPQLRALLISKRVGARFSVQGTSLPCCNSPQVPLFGFAPLPVSHDLSRFNPYAWPTAPLPGKDAAAPLARIEILTTCRAHLLERRATVNQWGPVFNMFDMHYKTSRRGTLYWGAVQADCGTPAKPLRFEIGPLVEHPGDLLDWDVSYARTAQHPGPITALIVFAAAFVLTRRARNRLLTNLKAP